MTDFKTIKELDEFYETKKKEIQKSCYDEKKKEELKIRYEIKTLLDNLHREIYNGVWVENGHGYSTIDTIFESYEDARQYADLKNKVDGLHEKYSVGGFIIYEKKNI